MEAKGAGSEPMEPGEPVRRRLLVAEDDTALQVFLRNLIQQGGSDLVVECTETVEATVERVVAHASDLLLLDLHRSPQLNQRVLELLRNRIIALPVLVILPDGFLDEVLRLLSFGIRGLLSRGRISEFLPTAIHTVSAGGFWVGPDVATALEAEISALRADLLQTARDRDLLREQLASTLNEREIEVIQRVGLGQSNAEIGKEIHISASTVKGVVQSALRKLGYKSRTEAALFVAAQSWRRRAAEQERNLRRLREEYSRILQTIGEGIWVLDHDRLTAYVSDRMAEMLGYTPGEMMGRPATDFIFDEDREALEERFRSRLTGGWVLREGRYRTHEGQELWAIISGAVLFDAEGRIAGGVALFTDITERKKMERSIRELGLTYQETLDVYRSIADDPILRLQRTIEELERHIAHEEPLRQLCAAARLELQELEERLRELENT